MGFISRFFSRITRATPTDMPTDTGKNVVTAVVDGFVEVSYAGVDYQVNDHMSPKGYLLLADAMTSEDEPSVYGLYTKAISEATTY